MSNKRPVLLSPIGIINSNLTKKDSEVFNSPYSQVEPPGELKSLGGKLLVNEETADTINSLLSETSKVELESIAKDEFNKVFGFLKNVDIPKQYIAIKCKVSNLSSSQRSRLLAYVTIRSQNEPEYKRFIEKLDKLYETGLRVVKSNESSNNG